MPLPIPGPGRPKGSKTKLQMEVAERLDRLGCDPVEGLALIMMQKCPCPTCDGTLRVRYTVGATGPYRDPEKGQEMTCRTCWGSGFEPISPELRVKAACDLMQYIAPKLRAIEHSTSDGKPVFVMMGARPDESAEEWEQRNGPDRKGKIQ